MMYTPQQHRQAIHHTGTSRVRARLQYTTGTGIKMSGAVYRSKAHNPMAMYASSILSRSMRAPEYNR